MGPLEDGSISSGPGPYTGNQACTWTISAGSAVTLTFSSFATEAGYDFVEVFDGSRRMGRFSGGAAGVPASLTALTGSMRVVFTSDSSVESDGFTASYSAGGSAVRTGMLPSATPSPVVPAIASAPCSGSRTLTARCVWIDGHIPVAYACGGTG